MHEASYGTNFAVDCILGLLTAGKLSKHEMKVQPKECIAFVVGTYNGFCPESLGEQLHQELENVKSTCKQIKERTSNSWVTLPSLDGEEAEPQAA